MIDGKEKGNYSSTINTEQQKHPLEQLASFEDHMQNDFGQQTMNDDESWVNDWGDEYDIDEETLKNIESWGEHRNDKDFDPTVRLTKDDLTARDIDSMGRKQNSFQQERAQELFERKLSEEMTDISELKLFAESGIDNMSTEKTHYADKEIMIINAMGYPLKFLKSSINSPEVINHPELWTINGKNYKSFSHFYGGGLSFNPATGEASNTICTTYVDTNINPDMAVGNTLSYIFTHIKPDSVIDAGPGDIWSDTDAGFRKPTLFKSGSLNMPSDIAKKSKGFNEVTLRRYDEFGNPLLPTAILIHDAMEVDDGILKSAAFFDIPIIHIHRQAYNQNPNTKEATVSSQ